MVSTFTPNIQIEEPARGDDVGTWDTPVNNNMTLLDLVCGGVSTISAAGGSVVLAAAQFKSNNITVNSTLAASITLTFPTSFIKPYTVGHLAFGSCNFTITLTTTATGGQAIAIPPGEFVDVFNDGANLKFRNLGRVGSYWDHSGSSVPNWVSGCTVPPYLNCDGTTFSSGTYPQLFMLLGGSTTLPDSRGRARAALNQGTGRMTSAGGGVDGNTLKAAGGTETKTLVNANLPAYTPSGSIINTGVTVSGGVQAFANAGGSLTAGGGSGGPSGDTALHTISVSIAPTFSGSAQGGTSTPLGVVQPSYISGITMIRAA